MCEIIFTFKKHFFLKDHDEKNKKLYEAAQKRFSSIVMYRVSTFFLILLIYCFEYINSTIIIIIMPVQK